MTRRALNSHGRAVVLCAWLAALSYCLPAAAEGMALSYGIKEYDMAFVGWCILVAMVGGLGRTVLTFLSTDVAIVSVLRETLRDLMISALAGAAAAVILYAVHSVGINIPVPVDVLILAACGWARMGFFVWAGDGARKIADSGVQWATNKITGRPTYASYQPPRWDNTYVPPPVPPPAPLRVDNPDQTP